MRRLLVWLFKGVYMSIDANRPSALLAVLPVLIAQ